MSALEHLNASGLNQPDAPRSPRVICPIFSTKSIELTIGVRRARSALR